MKRSYCQWSGIDRLIRDFIGIVLFIPFCPCHFVHTILSNDILSVYHFVHTFLSVPFCPLPFCPRTHCMIFHFLLITFTSYEQRSNNLHYYKRILLCVI